MPIATITTRTEVGTKPAKQPPNSFALNPMPQSMNTSRIEEHIKFAQSIAKEAFGGDPPADVVAAVMNAITAEMLNEQLELRTSDLCRAAAVAAGD